MTSPGRPYPASLIDRGRGTGLPIAPTKQQSDQKVLVEDVIARLLAGVEPVASPQLICWLVVPGEPVPKARARTFWDKRAGRTVSKTPEATAAATKRIQAYLFAKWPNLRPTSELLGLRVFVHCKGEGRGDNDNYEKLVADALQGRVVHNDNHFDETHTRRFRRSSFPRTEILVYRLARSS